MEIEKKIIYFYWSGRIEQSEEHSIFKSWCHDICSSYMVGSTWGRNLPWNFSIFLWCYDHFQKKLKVLFRLKTNYLALCYLSAIFIRFSWSPHRWPKTPLLEWPSNSKVSLERWRNTTQLVSTEKSESWLTYKTFFWWQ